MCKTSGFSWMIKRIEYYIAKSFFLRNSHILTDIFLLFSSKSIHFSIRPLDLLEFLRIMLKKGKLHGYRDTNRTQRWNGVACSPDLSFCWSHSLPCSKTMISQWLHIIVISCLLPLPIHSLFPVQVLGDPAKKFILLLKNFFFLKFNK